MKTTTSESSAAANPASSSAVAHLRRGSGSSFPGQGSPRRSTEVPGADGSRRWRSCTRRPISPRRRPRSTAVAQPAIVAASLAALDLLRDLGIEAETAVGHSLGELTALHWAGAFDADALLCDRHGAGPGHGRSAQRCRRDGQPGGGSGEVEALLNGEPVVIAGLNAPRQTVISGPIDAVDAVVRRARDRGFGATRLAVSHAFHSPMMARGGCPLSPAIAAAPIGTPHRRDRLDRDRIPVDGDVDVRELLLRQVTAPVRFLEAMAEASAGIDLWIEAGPGARSERLLAGREVDARQSRSTRGASRLGGLLCAIGAAFAGGAPVNPALLRTDDSFGLRPSPGGRDSSPTPASWHRHRRMQPPARRRLILGITLI